MRKMIMRKYGTSRIAQPTGAMNAARTRTDGRLGLRKAKRVKCFASFLTFHFRALVQQQCRCQLAHRQLRAEPWLKPSPSSFVLSFVAVALVMRSASCRETSRATKPVRLSIQHRVQRLLDRSTNHLTKMIPDPRLINLDHLSIGFSSPIGCSFILEEAVNPERSRWRASVHRQADRRVHRTTSTMASRSGSYRPGPASTRLVRHRQAMMEYRAREQLKDKVPQGG